eukprot:503231_1
MHAGAKRSGSSSNHEPPSKKRKTTVKDEEEDELEKFMKQINATASKQKKKALKKERDIGSKSMEESIQSTHNKKEERIDLNQDTPMDAFIEQMQSSDTLFLPKRKGVDGYNSDEEVYNVAKYVNKLHRDKKEDKNRLKLKKECELKYDDYGNIITPDRDRIIEDLEPVDHSKIYYSKFKRSFYAQHSDITNMTETQVDALRQKHNIFVTSSSKSLTLDDCRPVESFAYFGFEDRLMDVIITQNFSQPTPIQMQALPALLSGNNVMGLAKTGSGKTAAFVWPMIPHILDQDALEQGFDGPIAMILSPTRELASQTYKEVKRYVTPFDMRVAPLYGGLNMYEQRQMLQNGIEIMVATPGRLIDLIQDKSTNCRRITYVVIDEVDKMFSLGFEGQIRSIIGQIRKDKQICMFSATMNDKIERIASDTLGDYLRINIGNVHLSNSDVTQYVEVIRDDQYKFEWLASRVQLFVRKGLVIIFCQSKIKCETLSRDLNNIDVATGVIHGDKLQNNRQQIIDQFRNKKLNVLVATDVASRGVNIKDIKTVINYDCPYNMDSYIHRVGRTGRGGDKTGTAYTLLTPRGENDKKIAPHLLDLLRKLRMFVSPLLEQMVNGEFESTRKGKKKKNTNDNKAIGKQSKHEPLMNTFVKGTDTSMETTTKKTKTTFVFDQNDQHVPSTRKRKNRW